jgi:O-antigen/teichoic acid export membrane protein
MTQKKKVFFAGFWIILIFGLSQLVRLGSNLILTRLLEPGLFGIMAVVSVIIIGIEMFADLGLWAFVMRHKNPEDPHMLNVIWTIQVIRGWMVFFVVVLFAVGIFLFNKFYPNLVNGVYSHPLLPILILTIGSMSAVSGYRTLASPILGSKLQRGKLESVDLATQILSSVVMIVWVQFSPTIWALVSSNIAGTLVGVAMSYLIFPYRHKFTYDKKVAAEIFQFSKWIYISTILTYIFMQGDRLFFAGKITAAELGVYNIAFMLAGSFISVTQMLAYKIAYPLMSSTVNDNRHLLKQRYYKIRNYIDGPLFLACGLLIAVAPFIINVLYDERYTDAGWILQILVFSVVGTTLITIAQECLSALAITKIRMWAMLTRCIGLLITLPLFFSLYGLKGAVWAVSLNVWLGLPVVYHALAKNDVFSWYDEIKWLPAFGIGFAVGELFLYVVHKM